MSEKVTYTYKVAEGCEIRADVYPAGEGRPGPVVVWIHGGALIMGSRNLLRDWQRDLYLGAGYHVVSIDYRLAPETKLSGILQDLEDAFRWVREEGPGRFGADAARVAAIGHSAGGYLALSAGFRVMPPLQAVVSFYGYGDIVGDWYSRPDPFYCQQPRVSAEEARAAVGTEARSESHGQEDEKRERFYLYCRQQGLWPKEVVGYDPDMEPEAFERFCPVGNVTSEYPPTLLLHGDSDADVPCEQSVMMAEALRRAGVEHELITVAGGGHGFDGTEDAFTQGAFQRVLAFLRAQL